MFDNPRYVTAGINAMVDLGTQIILWNLIDNFDKSIEQDYLQVFDLSLARVNGKALQKIVHKQEVPEYKREYVMHSVEPIEAKIFAIDDESHSTLLLAEEY